MSLIYGNNFYNVDNLIKKLNYIIFNEYYSTL